MVVTTGQTTTIVNNHGVNRSDAGSGMSMDGVRIQTRTIILYGVLALTTST
jgi:hypothetical protein